MVERMLCMYEGPGSIQEVVYVLQWLHWVILSKSDHTMLSKPEMVQYGGLIEVKLMHVCCPWPVFKGTN